MEIHFIKKFSLKLNIWKKSGDSTFCILNITQRRKNKKGRKKQR